MTIRLTRWRVFLIMMLLVLLIDRVAKDWIVNHLDLYESIPVLPPFVQITRSYNTGAAFGIGGGAGDIFLVLAVLISGVIVYYVARSPAEARGQHAAFGLIVGGAMGNVIDRLQHGVVVDFVHLVLPGVISNVSNFADHAIVLGVFILLIDNFLEDRRKRQESSVSENNLV